VWGGRGKGGRGIQRNTVQPKDVHIEGFTLAFQGQTLLDRTVLKLANEHRYGLIGSNGVGKTTLLRRIATGSVPGWPQHMSSYLVQQEGVVRDDGTATTVLDTVLQSDITRNNLLEEEAFLMEVSAYHVLYTFARRHMSMQCPFQPIICTVPLLTSSLHVFTAMSITGVRRGGFE
jgi:ATPase subunit of ABC transporter with duplicated ATPase domains